MVEISTEYYKLLVAGNIFLITLLSVSILLTTVYFIVEFNKVSNKRKDQIKEAMMLRVFRKVAKEAIDINRMK